MLQFMVIMTITITEVNRGEGETRKRILCTPAIL
jgi:hypothetical protein